MEDMERDPALAHAFAKTINQTVLCKGFHVSSAAVSSACLNKVFPMSSAALEYFESVCEQMYQGPEAELYGPVPGVARMKSVRSRLSFVRRFAAGCPGARVFGILLSP